MSEVTICYGMTETSSVSFQTSPSDPVQERVSTVGRAHPHVQAKVVDPDSGMLLPTGVPGDQLPVVPLTRLLPIKSIRHPLSHGDQESVNVSECKGPSSK